MQLVRRFLGLPAPDRRLLIGALLLLWGVRLGLSTIPFRTLHGLLARVPRARASLRSGKRPPLDRVAWAVRVASRYVPQATCLTQALTAQALLARHGHPGDLRIGLARDQDGRLQGHAWVESRGRVVFSGSEDPSRFTALVPLE